MITKVLGAIWPLIIFPLLIYLNLQGNIDFGGGEKDIVIAIPMLVFSLFYIVSYIFMLRRKKKIYIAVILCSLTSFLLLIIITLLFAQFLGVKR